ncbi:MAG TPA: sigma 54-interacting transcriptional regulator, partial [Kofleriaceae bacterium]|nr:sigma 54-interacting transcriptional regulator [Kofleriaceae bacterium]
MEGPAPARDVVQTASASAGAPRADYLLVIDGERSWTIAVPVVGELVIGRGTDVQLRLDDELVSRTHAQLTAVPDGIRITDLGSRHGTLVNGQPLAVPRLLASGDVITVGNALLIVHRPSRIAGARGLLDGAALQRRLEEELERSLRYRRELAVVVLRGERPLDRARVGAAVTGRLRLIDAAAFVGDRELVLVLPEEDADFVGELARALAHELGVTAGIATAPADGVDTDTLLACAQAAATLPRTTCIAFARDAVHEIALGGHQVVLADPAMVRTYDLIKRLARSSLPVLIQGETGAGKELAAAAVHAYSPRATKAFISINCAAIPEHLAESELFGHERGAFTGAVAAKAGMLELASGGTVFLDELGELSLAVQAKLLRVLETQELQRVGDVKLRQVDIRIVAATNRDLQHEIAAGRFRQDLFFRLGAAQVVLPPLRNRPRDLAMLARKMIATGCERLGRRPLRLSIAAMQALFLHRWPGNVRELKHAMDYAAATAPDNAVEIDVWHLPRTLSATARAESAPAGDPSVTPDAPRSPSQPMPA